MAAVGARIRRKQEKKSFSEKLTEEQIKEYQDAFQIYDKDENGYITTRELKFLMRSLGCNPTDSELQQIVNEVDADGNGKIDLPEFINLMEKMTKPAEENASTLEAFRVFDYDGRGFIYSKMIREVILSALDQVPAEEVQDLIASSGLSNDRIVSYEEFSKMVTPQGLVRISMNKLHDLSSGNVKPQMSCNSSDCS